MDVYQLYSIKPAIIIASIWMIIIASVIGICAKAENSHTVTFFSLGPSNNTNFTTFKIDNWEKWVFIMTYSFLSQFIHSFINATLYPFMTNVIRDYKSEWTKSHCSAQLITLVYKLYYWFHDICDVFLVLTLQLQFYIPALIADILVGAITTRKFIKSKTKKNTLLGFDPSLIQ